MTIEVPADWANRYCMGCYCTGARVEVAVPGELCPKCAARRAAIAAMSPAEVRAELVRRVLAAEAAGSPDPS